jgi:putative tryptophan/tyrosine transport system substrate-binding protein
MTLHFIRFLVVCVLAIGMLQASAAPTRIAVIYAEADDLGASGFASLLGGIENTPGVEVILLSLKDIDDSHLSQMLMAAKQRNATLRLAAAGGNIGPIAVFYPDIGEPYRSVFSKIIEGIEETSQSKVASYAVGSNFNAQTVSEELKRQDIRVVIALGRNGLRAASGLDKDIGVVAGGVVSVSETELRSNAILSLAPDPALLFARLKMLSPKTQRVFVVYEPRQNGWLIKLAREAARNQGIELVAQEASDLKSALGIYQAIFASADARRDALWLPQDSATVDESLVMPHVLQESWNKNIPVFSSNVSHVKRGALFALYPNNLELGHNLATSAIGMASGNPTVRGVLPLRDVLTAFNTRTASHLGLAPSPAQQQGFDLLFPEQ